MTIIEMAKVAKLGEFWTRSKSTKPGQIISRLGHGFGWLSCSGSLCAWSSHIPDLLSKDWHRCSRDGKPLEDA